MGSSGDGRPHVSVIVPAYNEAPHLYENLTKLRAHLDQSPFTSELIVIDDGSSDDTSTEAVRFVEGRDDMKVVEHHSNFGLGQALRSGFRAARGDIYVAYDSDLSYSPDHIDRMVNTIDTTGAAVVVASPYMEGGSVTGVPRKRAILSKWANSILRRLSLHHISTVTGMVRAYDAAFIEDVSLKSMDNQINAEIIYKATLLRRPIVEIPAQLHWTRDEEETKRRSSSLRFVTMIIDSLFTGFIFRPFTFFIIPGVILMALAIYSLGWAAWHIIEFIPQQTGSFVWVITEAIGDAYRASPYSFLIGGIMLVVAIQLVSIGIMSAQNKRYFEELWFQGPWLANKLGAERGPAESDSQASDVTF